jgi:pyruvate dehydrogenase E2 component (dihydrolipoamide acetyltransferase)
MAFEFKLPDLGEGLTEGEIVKWLVKVGDLVEEGQVFVQVETDKAVIEIPSPQRSVVLELRAGEGEMVQVGQVIIAFGDEGEKPEAVAAQMKAQRPSSVGVVGELEEAPEEEDKPAVAEPSGSPPLAGAKTLAMPAVRKLAKELNVDINSVIGTGPHGRISRGDIQKAAEGEPAEKAVKATRRYDLYGYIERITLRGMRKTIARAMVQSKFTAPHVTATDEADVTGLVLLREKAKEKASKRGIHLTYLPFIMKAVVGSLEEHPYVNASLDEEAGEIILKKYYNIGVAVDTKDGLMAPVVKNVKGKSIYQLAQELTELSEKARSRTIDLADLKGGTFTISNYGAVGGIYGTPIINYPEVAILGVGKLLKRPWVVDGEIKIRNVLPLSISFDHRVVDGAEAARFVNTVVRYLEEPELILLAD